MGLGQLYMSEISRYLRYWNYQIPLDHRIIGQIVASFKNSVVLDEETRQPFLFSMSILEELSHLRATQMPR